MLNTMGSASNLLPQSPVSSHHEVGGGLSAPGKKQGGGNFDI